jgi:hypothetical protein
VFGFGRPNGVVSHLPGVPGRVFSLSFVATSWKGNPGPFVFRSKTDAGRATALVRTYPGTGSGARTPDVMGSRCIRGHPEVDEPSC